MPHLGKRQTHPSSKLGKRHESMKNLPLGSRAPHAHVNKGAAAKEKPTNISPLEKDDE